MGMVSSSPPWLMARVKQPQPVSILIFPAQWSLLLTPKLRCHGRRGRALALELVVAV